MGIVIPKTGCEKKLFDEESAQRIISDDQAIYPQRFFEAHQSLFSALLSVRFLGFSKVVLKKNPHNFGLTFNHSKHPVPFFWFGLGWSPSDSEGTKPSWGVSLEVNGSYIKPFMNNAGGLMKACVNAAAETERLEMYHFEKHVELAEWRTFDWLLPKINQRLALEQLWIRYLDLLVAWGIPEGIQSFFAQHDSDL